MSYHYGREERPPVNPGGGYPRPGNCETTTCREPIIRVNPLHKFCDKCRAARDVATQAKAKAKQKRKAVMGTRQGEGRK